MFSIFSRRLPLLPIQKLKNVRHVFERHAHMITAFHLDVAVVQFVLAHFGGPGTGKFDGNEGIAVSLDHDDGDVLDLF